MSRSLLAVIVVTAALSGQLAYPQGAAPAVGPFESATWATPPNAVDTPVLATLHKQRAELRPACSDEVFIRRAYVDVIGTLPTPGEVASFMQDKRPDKRSALVEALLARPEFADYWALKWCDLLRVKSEFPVNLWPNAVQAYNRWIHDAIRDHLPYDQFARALLTSSGSNFREPPVNFYRAVQSRDGAGIAKAVALNFMGERVEKWPAARWAQLATFFSRVAYKKTDEWKEEIVYLDPTATTPLKAVFPDGTPVTIAPEQDPRKVFTDWLLGPGNQVFTRNIVNRVWYWLMGRGIVHEPDDIRADNPAASPETLVLLEKELVAAHYDLRQVFRVILNSRTYQQSSLPHGDISDPKTQFAHYTVRRLDAEVLIDALCWIGGDGESYSSPIPEPYTFIPKDHRTIALADGSITSQFLETFGRPSRDTGLESERSTQPTDAQRLYMLNSTDVQRRVERGPVLRDAISSAKGNRADIIRAVYLAMLSRYPTQGEATLADTYFQNSKLQPGQAAADLAWALINTKEFLYRH